MRSYIKNPTLARLTAPIGGVEEAEGGGDLQPEGLIEPVYTNVGIDLCPGS